MSFYMKHVSTCCHTKMKVVDSLTFHFTPIHPHPDPDGSGGWPWTCCTSVWLNGHRLATQTPGENQRDNLRSARDQMLVFWVFWGEVPLYPMLSTMLMMNGQRWLSNSRKDWLCKQPINARNKRWSGQSLERIQCRLEKIANQILSCR